MDQSWISAIASVFGMAVTGFFGYLVASKNSRKDTDINARMSLSQDEKNFRNDLLQEIQTHREEVKQLRTDMDELIIINAQLKAENKILLSKVEELTAELKKFRISKAQTC